MARQKGVKTTRRTTSRTKVAQASAPVHRPNPNASLDKLGNVLATTMGGVFSLAAGILSMTAGTLDEIAESIRR